MHHQNNNLIFIDMNDKKLFREVLNQMAETYPQRDIKMVDTLVYIDGESRFNTDGYRLLYNIKRLADALEDELR